MLFSLEHNPDTLPFHYTDGKTVSVRISVAGGNARYVRVFDLPPEIPDSDVSSVLSTVKSSVPCVNGFQPSSSWICLLESEEFIWTLKRKFLMCFTSVNGKVKFSMTERKRGASDVIQILI